MGVRVSSARSFEMKHIFLPGLLVWVVRNCQVALGQGTGSATDPGRLQNRIDRPKEVPKKVAPLSAPTIPELPETKFAKRFRLIGADIVGSTVYSPARLGDFYEPYLNREISPTDINAIVKAITEQYRKDGYFLARVIAPPQRVEFGVLRLRIIEGFIEEIAFQGEKPGRSALFDAWVGRITAEIPLKLSTLERNLLLMASIPGLSVTPGLKEKDSERGAYALEIGLKHTQIDGFSTFDNRGTTTVGPLQLYTGLKFNSAIGLLERTRLAVFTTPPTPEELLHFEFQQDHILNSHGTQGWFFASRSSVDIGQAGTSSKENSHGTRLTLGFSHPWIRSRDQNLTVRSNSTRSIRIRIRLTLFSMTGFGPSASALSLTVPTVSRARTSYPPNSARASMSCMRVMRAPCFCPAPTAAAIISRRRLT